MSGVYTRNPNDITKKAMMDICFTRGRRRVLLHNSKLSSGDRIKSIEGIPMIKCSLRGRGNIPAPAIDTEYEKSGITGTMLIPIARHARYNPIKNGMLRAEHNTKPAEKRY
jgi:hypothetical protein